MTKQEFLQALGEKLSEDLPAAEVLRQIQYYEGYIDAETGRGRDEKTLLEELGDPILIARNVAESPVTHRNSWNTQSPYEQGYVQGSYESRVGRQSTASARAQQEMSETGSFRDETSESSFRQGTDQNSKPDGIWRKASEPEELRQRGQWQKAPDPQEQPEILHGKVDRPRKTGLAHILIPLLLAAVLVIAFIVGIVTGAISMGTMVLPLILLAAAVILVIILVRIRKR